MKVEPQEQHRWLKQLVGEWRYEGECGTGPDSPPGKYAGVERVRALGDVWVILESQCEMPGVGPTEMMISLGHDPELGRFRGSWIGTMMPQLWIYDGTLDASAKVLTLASEGPSMTGDGTIGKYEDSIEIVDADHRIFRGRMQAPDGSWVEFMTARYTRVA